jgi:hypothetical protein
MVMTFAGLALLLAMVGVFGVLAYSVQQRVREFGVRIALGATTRSVLGLVLGSAARLIALGAVIGLTAAALLAQDDLEIPVWCAAARPDDVRGGCGRADAHSGDCGSGTSVTRSASRSGGGISGRVT